MKTIATNLVALTSRFSGSVIEMQMAPKEVATKKGRSNADKAAIASKWGSRLPIKKVYIGASEGLLGSYETKVNGQRLIEGVEDNFDALKPSGKTHIGGNIYVSDKDENKFYLGYEPTKGAEKIFVDNKGVQLTEEEQKEILTSADLPKEGSSRQEVEDTVKWITVGLESLSWVKIGGKTIAI